MPFFLHYHPQSDFIDGIFTPFNTLDEAQMQASSDLLSGVDPEYIMQIFEADYGGIMPEERFGLINDTPAEDRLFGHLVEANRVRVKTSKQIAKEAGKFQERLLQDSQKGESDYVYAMHMSRVTGQPFTDFLGEPKAVVPGNAYAWNTGGTATAGACALAAATAKTILYIVTSTICQPAIVEIDISFDGVTASAVPVLVELVSSTAGTAGTPRAALAAGKQLRGWPAQTSQTTCADSYTVEPGTSLVNRKWLDSPNGGLYSIQFPMSREPTGIVTAATDAKAWGVRCTAPAIVNVHASLEFEE
jgi:hypothetical protein